MLFSTARRWGGPILGAKVRGTERASTPSHFLILGVVAPRSSRSNNCRSRGFTNKPREEVESSSSSSTMKGGTYDPLPLAYVSYERPSDHRRQKKSPLLIHHSLFGSKENWKNIGRELSFISRRSVFAVDARNHGESPRSGEMSLALMADDAASFAKATMTQQQISFMGHGLGGRIGMVAALTYPRTVGRLVAVDSTPLAAEGTAQRHGRLLKAAAALKNMEPELRRLHGYSRMSAASKAVEPILKDSKPDVAAVLSNLKTKDDDSIWNVNLDSILSNPGLAEFPSDLGSFDGPTLFIQGTKSRCVAPSDEPKIRRMFPNAEFAWLDDCGHWIHLEKHEEFLQRVVEFLDKT